MVGVGSWGGGRLRSGRTGGRGWHRLRGRRRARGPWTVGEGGEPRRHGGGPERGGAGGGGGGRSVQAQTRGGAAHARIGVEHLAADVVPAEGAPAGLRGRGGRLP